MDHLLHLTPKQAIPHLTELLGWAHMNDLRLARILESQNVTLANGNTFFLDLRIPSPNTIGHNQGGILLCNHLGLQFYTHYTSITLNATEVGVFDVRHNAISWKFSTEKILTEVARTLLGLGMIVQQHKLASNAEKIMSDSEEDKLDKAFLEKWA